MDVPKAKNVCICYFFMRFGDSINIFLINRFIYRLTSNFCQGLKLTQGGEDDLQKESAENAKSTIQCENRHMLTLMPYSSTFSFEPSRLFSFLTLDQFSSHSSSVRWELWQDDI